MRWLISCVNLTRLRDAYIAGKTLFLGVSDYLWVCLSVFVPWCVSERDPAFEMVD